MDAEKFINTLNVVVKDVAIKDVISILKSPPGRRPLKELVDLSNFYNAQSEEFKALINQIIKHAVDDTLFGMLCVLDGVRAIDDGDNKGKLILTYHKSSNSCVVLNENEDLHDIYNAANVS